MKLTNVLVAGAGAVVALVLTGCATNAPTTAQEEVLRIQTLSRDSDKQYFACQNPIDTNPRYAKISQNFGFGSHRSIPNAAQLANTEAINDEDVGILFDWYAESQQCNTELAERMGRIDPAVGALVVGAIREITEFVDDIVRSQARPTIGNINAKSLSIQNRLKLQLQEWAQRTNARLRAEHQEEMATRQQNAETAAQAVNLLMTGLQILAQRQALIASAQQQYIVTHPTYTPRLRVSTTNCQFVAQRLTCTQIRY